MKRGKYWLLTSEDDLKRFSSLTVLNDKDIQKWKQWHVNCQTTLPNSSTRNTAEREESRKKTMHWRHILNNCVCHNHDLTLLGSRPTAIMTQIYYYHCPDLLLLWSKAPTITTRPTTITIQPYYYYDTNLLLLRPKIYYYFPPTMQ